MNPAVVYVLTQGLDILPRRKLEHRGHTLEEFDTTVPGGVLARS